MRGARPGRRINKIQQKSEDAEKDLKIEKIANDVEEYIVLSESLPVSRSLSSSSGQSSEKSSSSDESTSPILLSKNMIRNASNTGSGGSGKSLESGTSADKDKKSWKMDDFYRIYSCKKYISGYLYMVYGKEWIKVYAVITGEMLRVVKVPDLIAVQTYESESNLEQMVDKEINPSLETLELFNQDEPVVLDSIKDSLSAVYSSDYTSDIQPLPPIPYTCFFSIDKYSFASSSFISANSWVHAAMLSAFEYGLLNVHFSFSLLRVVPYIRIWSDFDILPFKSRKVKHLEWDGDCKIRLQVQSEWKEFYCKINSAGESFVPNLIVYRAHTVSEENDQKSSGVLSKFFHGKKSNSNEIGKPDEPPKDFLVSPAQMTFFSSISDYKKGAQPIFIMTDVSFVYALWPKTMHHIKSDAVNEIKIMGSFKLLQENGKWAQLLNPDKNSQPCSVNLQSANTHESLHWLVAILGAFALDADVNSFDINAAVWCSPPTDWGDLCLKLDEVAGLSGSISLLGSFYEYYKLLNGKKSMLKNGLFSEWQRSVKNSVDTRRDYERKEVELKVNALLLWLYKLKNGEIHLPNWVENELNEKIGPKYNDSAQNKSYPSDSEIEDDRSPKNRSELDINTAGSQRSGDALKKSNKDQLAINAEDATVENTHLQRVSSEKRKAAKNFLLGLSESLPKMFERGEGLPSSVWYQEEESRIKEREEFVGDQASPIADIPIYEANSLLEKEAKTVKKSGLENFHIPEKQVHIFAENSLLDRTAMPRASMIKSVGPLLGEVQKEGNKPKLEGGLLGQMDLKEKEYAHFRKSGGYRATMIPQPTNPLHMVQVYENTETINKRNSSLSSTGPNLAQLDVRYINHRYNESFSSMGGGQTSNNPPIMPVLDPRTSLITAQLDPRMSFINQPLDPRISFINHPLDPRMSFINQPLDPRFSFLSQPQDPRVSMSLKDSKHLRLNPVELKLNSLPTKSNTQSVGSSESSESGNDPADTGSGEESGTDSSSEGSSSDEHENQEPLFANLKENEDDSSGSDTSGSSSASSSADSSKSDENDLENFKYPVPYPMFGQAHFQNHLLGIPPPMGPQFLPGNFQMNHVQPIDISQSSVSKTSDSSSASSGAEESPINDKPKNFLQNDSGTESDSSASADESAVKKPRSFVLPGKRK